MQLGEERHKSTHLSHSTLSGLPRQDTGRVAQKSPILLLFKENYHHSLRDTEKELADRATISLTKQHLKNSPTMEQKTMKKIQRCMYCVHIYIYTHTNVLTIVRLRAVCLERSSKSSADQREQPPLRKSHSLTPHSVAGGYQN